jgi:serine/threonine-protein kinase PpkA
MTLSRRSLLATSGMAGVAAILPRTVFAASQPLLMPGKRNLFQRVIARPSATLHPAPTSANGQAVLGFTVFYVYARQGEGDSGWVQVGPAADGVVQGWIPASKVIDWKHTMIAAFTNPAGRQPVLFLQGEQDARALLTAADPAADAARLRQAAQAHQPGPVLAIEPANFVDITQQFYLLPILHAEEIETDSGASARLLEVVSATTESPRPPPPANEMAQFKAGVVFVVETNISMQPTIESSRDAIRTIIERIGNSEVKNNFRFGMIGYRDSLLDTPRLEYTTRVFAKPDFNQPPDAIEALLTTMRDAPVSSNSFDEDPIAGIKAAIDEINWDALGGRYIVLITHAGARDANHPHSFTHLGIPEIRQLAQARGIAIFVVHLLDPIGATFHNHEKAAAQYRALTRTDAVGSLYYPVPGGGRSAFLATVTDLADSLMRQVSQTIGHALPPTAETSATGAAQMHQQIAVVAQAMKLAYLGRIEHSQAPDVLHGFTTDRDTGDLTRRSLDVRVLLTRNQLSDLALGLKNILAAGIASRIDPATFFGQLRTAFAVAARDPQQLAHMDRLGGLLGEYLDGLPYRSDIMNISEPDWLAMGGIAQAEVLSGVEAKLRLYQEFQAQPGLWVNLSGSDHPDEAAYPVPIDALP